VEKRPLNGRACSAYRKLQQSLPVTLFLTYLLTHASTVTMACCMSVRPGLSQVHGELVQRKLSADRRRRLFPSTRSGRSSFIYLFIINLVHTPV